MVSQKELKKLIKDVVDKSETRIIEITGTSFESSLPLKTKIHVKWCDSENNSLDVYISKDNDCSEYSTEVTFSYNEDNNHTRSRSICFNMGKNEFNSDLSGFLERNVFQTGVNAELQDIMRRALSNDLNWSLND